MRDGKPADAVPELRAALKENPTDAATKYHLALALVQLQQKDEAVSLLQQVIEQNQKYADAYYQLGKLQLEGGDAKQAVSSLESAANLSPQSDYIHYQLSLAYSREARADDAQREMQLYQALKTQRRGDHEQLAKSRTVTPERSRPLPSPPREHSLPRTTSGPPKTLFGRCCLLTLIIRKGFCCWEWFEVNSSGIPRRKCCFNASYS